MIICGETKPPTFTYGYIALYVHMSSAIFIDFTQLDSESGYYLACSVETPIVATLCDHWASAARIVVSHTDTSLSFI